MNFIGEECYGCGRTFGSDDDVVVCPECGTPYHRECYKEAGECVNHQLHESGGSWKRASARKAEELLAKADGVASAEGDVSVDSEDADAHEEKICPRCGCHNEHNAACCLKCGMPLQNAGAQYNNPHGPGNVFVFPNPNFNNGCLGFDPEETMGEDVTMKEVSDFVATNTLYYLPLFKRMKATASKISMNFVCLIFPSFYFANRKMWLWTILTALISMLLTVPTLLLMLAQQETALPFMQDITNFIIDHQGLIVGLADICSMADWVTKFLACLFANWLYYRHTIKSIGKLKRRYGGPVSPAGLRAKGGTQPANILLTVLIQFGLAMALSAGVLFVLIFMQSVNII